MAEATLEENGKAEKIGELRGRLTALVVQVEHLVEQQTQTQRSQEELAREQAKMLKMHAEHVAFHRGKEDAEAKAAEQASTDRRWSVQMILMTAGIFLSFGVSVLSLFRGVH